MIDRCLNPRNKNFRHYGGRGITVCARWREFSNFLADMGHRPAGMTLERIDTDGNYSARNCKWATWIEQQRNTRRNRIVTHAGRSMPLAAWAEELGVSYSALKQRLRRNGSFATRRNP